MQPVVVAVKAHLGWVNTVAVDANAAEPVPVEARRIDLLPNDAPRDLREPYHVAGGWDGLERVARPPDPAAVIEHGRRQQTVAAQAAFDRHRTTLADAGFELVRAVVLARRGYVHEDLEDILGSHAHIHVAEGDAVRDATRAACDALGIPHVDQDEKSTLAAAGERLDCEADACDELMKAHKPEGARSWRKEERMIALAAWLHRT